MEAACNCALDDFQQRAQWQPEAAQAADQLLENVVLNICPDQQAWEQRNAAIQRINNVLRSMPDFMPDHLRYHQHGRSNGSSEQCLAQLLLFDSFCSGLWHKGSDLDLTITGRWRNRHGQLLDMGSMLPRDLEDMLHRILRTLTAAGVATSSSTQPATVIRARVPLIAFVEAHSGVAVDISVDNHSGTFKSIFTWELTQFDARFVTLYRLVKYWAEVHGLNDPKCGTLNSWSITQMVLFHLQTCRPAVLPPLWQFFQNEPHTGPRPLEQEAADQQGGSRSSSASSSRGRGTPKPRQQGSSGAAAPYQLLDVCGEQRARLQPMYNTSSRDFSNRPLALLAGFLVRYREVLHQWCELGQHRSVKLSTWFGSWLEGGQAWRHDYVAAIEDPFDPADNTARTLGTMARNDGGCQTLLAALTASTDAISQLHTLQDVDLLMQTLVRNSLQQVQQPGFDAIGALMQQHQQHIQQQRMQQQQGMQQGGWMQQGLQQQQAPAWPVASAVQSAAPVYN